MTFVSHGSRYGNKHMYCRVSVTIWRRVATWYDRSFEGTKPGRVKWCDKIYDDTINTLLQHPPDGYKKFDIYIYSNIKIQWNFTKVKLQISFVLFNPSNPFQHSMGHEYLWRVLTAQVRVWIIIRKLHHLTL